MLVVGICTRRRPSSVLGTTLGDVIRVVPTVRVEIKVCEPFNASNPVQEQLSCVSTSGWLYNLGDLITSTNNALASRVKQHRNVLVLGLGTFPDLYLTSTPKDTNTHSRQEVVGSVRVKVDATIEDGCGVLADRRRDERLTTGMVLDEIGNVVDNTGNGNKCLAVLRLGHKIIPADDWKLLKWGTPIQSGSLLVKLLL